MDEQSELSNPELVTIAVFSLGGTYEPVELEDVAIAVFDIAPMRFSWKKYVDRIDLRIVLYSVNDAIKPDVGYLKGNSKFGYMLTETGLKWVTKNQNHEYLIKSARKLSESDLKLKEVERLKRTQAYKKFEVGEKEMINLLDFREFTRVNDNFPPHLRDQRFARLQNIIEDDEILISLWKYLKSKFINKE